MNPDRGSNKSSNFLALFPENKMPLRSEVSLAENLLGA